MANGTIEQLMSAISKAVPPGISDDIKKNIAAALKSKLDQLGLVTREELEVQELLLSRLRQQLTELEQKIVELEKQRK
ncbi:MAG: accessory factor UbiK family protein [Gammaproteobacteria bacterium]|nr:accessory factor UbiK family protein [Gammaproteobacteria bacterium]